MARKKTNRIMSTHARARLDRTGYLSWKSVLFIFILPVRGRRSIQRRYRQQPVQPVWGSAMTLSLGRSIRRRVVRSRAWEPVCDPSGPWWDRKQTNQPGWLGCGRWLKKREKEKQESVIIFRIELLNLKDLIHGRSQRGSEGLLSPWPPFLKISSQLNIINNLMYQKNSPEKWTFNKIF